MEDYDDRVSGVRFPTVGCERSAYGRMEALPCLLLTTEQQDYRPLQQQEEARDIRLMTRLKPVVFSENDKS